MLKNLRCRSKLILATVRKYSTDIDISDISESLVRTKKPVVKAYPVAKYGGRNLVVLTVQPESQKIADTIKEVFTRIDAPILFEDHMTNIEEKDKPDDTEPVDYISAVKRNGIVLRCERGLDSNSKWIYSTIRNDLNLFASCTQFKSYNIPSARHKNVDIILFSQNMNRDLEKLQYEPVPGMIPTLLITTRKVIVEYLHFVLKYCVEHNRRRVTLAHKLKYSPIFDGLFLRSALEMSLKSYPGIEIEFMDLKRMSRYLVMNPGYFDVICLSGRESNSLSSILCGLSGGPDLFCIQDLGYEYALFQSATSRISYTDQKSVTLLSVAVAARTMLTFLKHKEHAHIINSTIMRTLIDRQCLPKEVGGKASQEEFNKTFMENLY